MEQTGTGGGMVTISRPAESRSNNVLDIAIAASHVARGATGCRLVGQRNQWLLSHAKQGGTCARVEGCRNSLHLRH